MRIWKWTLATKGEQTIDLPLGAQILSVQMQGEAPQLWALVDEREQRKQGRRIAIYGTGGPVPDNPGKYIGTFQDHAGTLMFHAFERCPPRRMPPGTRRGRGMKSARSPKSRSATRADFSDTI